MMLRTLLITLTAIMLISCSKGHEIQLLSADNSHMLYLYPDNATAELYTGMSKIADYTLLAKNNIYTLTSKNNPVYKIQLILDMDNSEWACRGCKKQGFSRQWHQQ